MTKRPQSGRRNSLQKCFHSLKYTIDHTNVHFFFLISLQTCFIKLCKLFTLLHPIPFVLLAASLQPRLQLSQVYSHTNFLSDSVASRRNLETAFSAGGLVNFLNISKTLLICIVLHTFSHFFLPVLDALLNRTQGSSLFT